MHRQEVCWIHGKCKDNYEEREDVTYKGIMSKADRKYQVRELNNEH
jgi:lipase chaperone LimK